MNERILNTIWINPDFFDEEMSFTSIPKCEENKLERAFEIWEFANKQIIESDNYNNKDQLNSGVTSLKRAYNKTIQIVNESLGLQQLKEDNGQKISMITLLENFGIVKTKTLNTFLDIRNKIEHQDMNPPERNECILFSEYIWCLLKIISMVFYNYTTSIEVKNDFGMMSFEFRTVPRNNAFYPEVFVYGAIRSRLVSFIEGEFLPKCMDVELIDDFSDSDAKEEFKNIDLNNKICFRGKLELKAVKRFIKDIIISENGGESHERMRRLFD